MCGDGRSWTQAGCPARPGRSARAGEVREVADFYPAGDDPVRTVRLAIVDALRRYGADASRLGQTFAGQHRLQHTDLEGLVAIMTAQGTGRPLTPGRLRQHLGLSSAGTSYVVDRLERGGYVRRVRDHPTDNRIVHLRPTERGMAVGVALFAPLGRRTDEVMDQFSLGELLVVLRFVNAIADSMRAHLTELRTGQPIAR
ncbi:MAG TPA: MarR family transcriptional regulator [Jatrophihabitans sp.]|nr:MarR family transcriptional regulator [Jatrophihabitans sp.]